MSSGAPVPNSSAKAVGIDSKTKVLGEADTAHNTSGSGEINSQNCKATQPIMAFETQDVNVSCDDDTESQEKPWGKFLSYNGSSVAFDLTDKDEYSFGRTDDCEYCFNQNPVIRNSQFFQAYSKVHFKVKKDYFKGNHYTVALEDKSSNGTFINGELVGKNKKCALSSDDIISLSAKGNKVFIFIDPSASEDTNLPDELRKKYRLSRVLGRGACGEVRLALEKGTNRKFAVKIIQKRKFTVRGVNQMNLSQAVKNEVNILKSLDHPCIIRIEDVIDNMMTMYIVLELIEGGELFERVVDNGAFSEPQAKLLFYQMVQAIKYLHDMNISHRDLKPENVLLQSSTTLETLVKITDFGLSKLVESEGEMMRTFCGTPNYLAPEILRTQGSQAYTNAVDVWSLGVILYICLCGYPPFTDDRRDLKLAQQILQASYTFNPRHWGGVSDQAKDLVRAMLTVNPKERISLADALQHPWLQDADMKSRAHTLMYGGGSGDGVSTGDVPMPTVVEGEGNVEDDSSSRSSLDTNTTTSASPQPPHTSSTSNTTPAAAATTVADVTSSSGRARRKRVQVGNSPDAKKKTK